MTGAMALLIWLVVAAIVLTVVWFIFGLFPVVPENTKKGLFLLVVLLVLLYLFGGYLGRIPLPNRL